MLNRILYQIVFNFLLVCGIFACSLSQYKLSDPIQLTSADNTNIVWPADNPAAVYINGNLWYDIQDYLQFPDYSYRPEVQEQIRWLQIHQASINHLIKQAAPYIHYIYEQTQKRNLPAELALLPMIESAYDPFKYSKAGATGLWQLMPGTASGLRLKIDWWYDGRRDIVASTKVAFDYLAYLNDFFTNDWLLAIAAYNCGEGAVQAAVDYNRRRGRPTDFWSLRLPAQTKIYVPKLLALSTIIRDPERFGMNLTPINNAPYLKQINIGSQIDLNQAAKLAGVSETTIRKLNPGYRRWATDPDGPYALLIPVARADGFVQRLNALPKDKRVTWREYIVRKGDTLSTIAYKYKTNSRILKQVNSLHNNKIRPKQQLLIPVAFHGSIKSPIVEQRATIAEEKLPGPNRVIHIVENGETLWTLAEKYGVTVREICFWNNLKPRQRLSSNQKLLIWAPSHAKLIYTRTYTYKVLSGDSVWLIARRFNSSVKKISRINHIKNNVIHTGQVLTVPGSIHHTKKHKSTSPHKPSHQHYIVHTVKPGDSLDKIAHKFHIGRDKLKKWNNMEKVKYIYPGQKIYIYR
jgi:membrane-bound lytic murein transglycosylase D